MVEIIDKAVADQDICEVPRAAERGGIIEGETKASLSQRGEYSFTHPNGGTVRVECYWYDTSRAISIRPNRHVMKVAAEAEDDKRSYAQHYET